MNVHEVSVLVANIGLHYTAACGGYRGESITGSISRTCPGFAVYVRCLSHVVCARRLGHVVDAVGVESCVDVYMCAVI